MSLAETYARVRPGIVAFIPRYYEQIKPGSLPFEHVFGTGFIVGDSLVASNAHVLDVADTLWNKETQEHDVSVLFFVKVDQGMANLIYHVKQMVAITKIKPEEGDFYYGPERADLGLVSLDCKGLSKYMLHLNSDPVEEGISIATAGFPMGKRLLHLEGQLDHISPTLQAGIISAVLPFASANPHGYLANIMVQGGASGSPVFLPETGEVIGVIKALRFDYMQAEIPMGDGKVLRGRAQVPINFSHVVPSHYLRDIIATESDTLMSFVPSDAPQVDEHIEALPKTFDSKIVSGQFEKSRN